MSQFELWSSDLFDRDSAPSLEGTFNSLPDGLVALWRKTLEQGVQDDGRPTFTEFSLRGGGRTRFLPRDPFRNLHLGVLRRRALEREGFVDEVVRLQLERFGTADLSLGWLVAATTVFPTGVQAIVDELALRLGHVVELWTPADDGSCRAGPLAVLPVLAPLGWRIEVREWEGAFAVVISDGVSRVECDDVPPCHVLRDALLEGGQVTEPGSLRGRGTSGRAPQ